MFNVLFLFSAVGGLCLGVRMSMRHAEIHNNLLNMKENGTNVSPDETSDTPHDTEQVDGGEANPEENSPDMEVADDPVTDPVIEESPSIAQTPDEPVHQDSQLENPEEASLDQEDSAVLPEISTDFQKPAEPAPVIEMISELVELPMEWPTSEMAEQVIQMVSEKTNEMEQLASLSNEVQNMLIECECVTSDVVETHWIFNSDAAKYVNRVICRPRLGNPPKPSSEKQ